MCGSTAAQTTNQQEQAQFYSQLSSEYSTVFGEDQTILQNLTAQLTPIINAGASQQGFSQAEQNSLNTQSTEQTAAGVAKAEQAVGQNAAAAGGGNTFLPSGATTELQGQIDATGAQEDASQKNQIQLANYQQGAANYNNALSAEMGVAGQLNPEGFAGQTTSAGVASGNTANQIAQQGNSVWTSVMGALGGVAGSAAQGFNFGGAQTLDTSGGAPLTGGIDYGAPTASIPSWGGSIG